ncbi:MAG: lipase family protein [Cellvibrionaceae bacterium]
MGNVSSGLAAKLAKEVYVVRNEFRLKTFLSMPEFSSKGSDKNVLTAKVGSRLINARDNFGLCARGSGEYENDLFLIFRGTTGANYGADIVTDLRTGLNVCSTGSAVHSGFNHAFNSLRDQLADFISKQSGVQTIHCIGHSLGGAVANLAADWASSTYGKKVRLYTFGSPRVGCGAGGFSDKLTTKLKTENIYRVFHGTDPVPMVPLFPFFHAPTVGHPCYLPYGGLVINPKAHFMDNYESSVGDKPWDELRRPQPSFSSSALKLWLKSDSVENAHSSTFWEKLNHAAAFVVQTVLARVAVPVVAGLTVADYLAMILQKGLEAGAEIAGWVLFLIRKMMRMLGMKLVETAEDITTQILRLVLNRVTKKINNQVKNAISFIA